MLHGYFSGEKLRELCGSSAVFAMDDDIKACLLLWARKTKVANMSLERLLALMKASCDDDHPLIERLAAASYLTQWLRTHQAAGGVDPRRAQARSDLLQRGVPLAAGRSKHTRAKSRCGAKPTHFTGAMAFVKRHRLKVWPEFLNGRDISATEGVQPHE